MVGQLRRVQAAYALRRDLLCAALSRHCADPGLGVSWDVPTHGMFVWVRIRGAGDTNAAAVQLIDQYILAVVPGAAFAVASADGTTPHCECFRLSFTQLTEKTAELAALTLRRYAAALRAASREGMGNDGTQARL